METATLTQQVTETVETPTREFSLHDRCDHCGFQAYFVAFRERIEPAVGSGVEGETTQELLLCKNRGEKHGPALVLAGWTVLDFTDKINEKPSVSANAI